VNGPIAPISITGPPAIIALLFLWWYYNRLNRADIAPSRRKIRQVSVVLMVLEVPLLLVGTSLADHRLDQEQFVWVWLAAIVLLVLIMWMMLLDALNSLLLSRRDRQAWRTQVIANLKQAQEELRHRSAQSDESEEDATSELADGDSPGDAGTT
jgi:hypothetical protein